MKKKNVFKAKANMSFVIFIMKQVSKKKKNQICYEKSQRLDVRRRKARDS